MVQDDEAAVYHRDKRLDAIWSVCADEFVTELPAVAIDPVVALGPWLICTHAGRDELWVSWHPAGGSGSFLDPH